MPAEQINVTLGTAGHIDHGKTALVKLLTGCDTDRLKEEKERGMSIDLGFAPCKIGDLEVGIVDVPGHENFIKTMVAGATGMDAVLLVVAADDGVMPQTREHLDILTLLGVRHGFVALTKIDRVDSEHRELVLTLTREFLRGTFLEEAPICPVSSITGEGFEAFYETLCRLTGSVEPRRLDGVFRLPVDRAFSAHGFGTVVAGIPLCGSARVDDEVVLLPAGTTGRIRQIEVYGRPADMVRAGQCAAINIRHWDAGTIRRGQVLTLPGYFEPQEWFTARLRLLPGTKLTLKSGTQLRLHTGTADMPAKVFPLESDSMTAGGEGLVQFRVPGGLVAGPGDPLIVRLPSPARTIGGGILLEGGPRRLKRNRPDTVELVRQCAEAVSRQKDFIAYAVRTAPAGAAGAAELSVRTKTRPETLGNLLAGLAAEGEVVEAGAGLFIHRDVLAEVSAQALKCVGGFHKNSPESPGMAPDALRGALKLDKPVSDALMSLMKTAGRLTERNGLVALPGHSAVFQGDDARYAEAIEALFLAKPFQPPGIEELIANIGADQTTVERIITVLRQHKRLVRVEGGLLFHRDAVEQARERLVDFLNREGRLESVKFKYLLDTTRKFAIPLLDYFDAAGVTRRVGNTRYLK
ncbi:MAG: selenocysteine-specific translation elongation factor [Thermoguttaceae bacterium]|jgi:selenocysteine-specific elongation factor|nr:selenocysteine-specific translation elongation factor [Thermoguttaceae bacterium]